MQKPETTTGVQSPLFELSRLNNTFSHAPELIPEMLALYADSIEQHQAHCRQRNSIDDIHQAAHAIKGSAAECGATAASLIAQKIERACIENQTETVLKLLPELHQTLGQTLCKIRDTLKNYH